MTPLKFLLQHFRDPRFPDECLHLFLYDEQQNCHHLLLLTTEARNIAKHSSKKLEEFSEKVEDCNPYTYRMKKTQDAKCIFLKDKLCSIYQIRPIICRFYPFQLNMRNNRYTFTYTNECKGIGKGSNIKKNYYERLFTLFLRTVREDSKTEH